MTHPFDSVPLPSPSRKYRDTCGVCGGLMKDHPEAPENMRELLHQLAEALCDTSVVARTLRDRLAKYRSPVSRCRVCGGALDERGADICPTGGHCPPLAE